MLVAVCWALALVLPHFQSNPSAAALIADSIITGLLGWCGFTVMNSRLSTNKALKLVFTSIAIGGFAIGFVWAKFSNSFFYELWSRFGAGTMKINEEVIFFGDLAHLTSAADCLRPITIGTNVCDPWGRLYNQNPDVGDFFRALHFTNTNLVGILATLAFLFVFFFAVKFFMVKSVGPFLILLTPVFVLALDRGNEVTTITLLMIGIIGLHRNQNLPQMIGALMLFLAVLLKLWPIFFVLFLLLFQWKRLKIMSRVLLITPFFYMGFKFQEIRGIVEATQSGSPFGTSFGLRLFLSSQLNLTQISILMFLTLGLGAVLVKHSRLPLIEFMGSDPGIDAMRWVSPLMLTYIAIWASGDSFIYRMLVLLPLVFIMSQQGVFELLWSKIVISAILLTLITSRLPVTTAVSSALALFFIFSVFWTLRSGKLEFRRQLLALG